MGDNLLVFYYLSPSEIWLDKRHSLWWCALIIGVAFGGSGLIKRHGLWWEGLIRVGLMLNLFMYFNLLFCSDG